nr:hypothetical protein CFP56_01131 [Quercus suber]
MVVVDDAAYTVHLLYTSILNDIGFGLSAREDPELFTCYAMRYASPDLSRLLALPPSLPSGVPPLSSARALRSRSFFAADDIGGALATIQQTYLQPLFGQFTRQSWIYFLHPIGTNEKQQMPAIIAALSRRSRTRR